MPDPPPPAVLQLTAEQLQNIIAGSIAGALQQAQAQGLGGGTAGAATACPLAVGDLLLTKSFGCKQSHMYLFCKLMSLFEVICCKKGRHMI